MNPQPVLIDGEWRPSVGKDTFQAVNPATCEALPEQYPVSPWSEIEQAVSAAERAFREMSGMPGEKLAKFLERFADRLEGRKEELVNLANMETGLP